MSVLIRIMYYNYLNCGFTAGMYWRVRDPDVMDYMYATRKIVGNDVEAIFKHVKGVVVNEQ